MRLSNSTACADAEAFIQQEAAAWRTEGLTVVLRSAETNGAPCHGRFNCRLIRILVAVSATAGLPVLLRRPVRTDGGSDGQFRWVYDEELAETPDDLMVWVFFHEFHHFLCGSEQARGDWETRANALGFEMLRKFKAGRSCPSLATGG